MAAGEGFGGSLAVKEKDFVKQQRSGKQPSYDVKPSFFPVDSLFLHETGIRGCKKNIFYIVVIVLFFIALGNLLTTFVLLGVLRLGYGIESFEFFPPGLLLRFLSVADLQFVFPLDGRIGGFAGENLEIFSNNQPLSLQVHNEKPTTLVMDTENTTLSDVDLFLVRDPTNGQQIFSSEYTEFGLPKAVKKLIIEKVQVSTISSPSDRSLIIRSDSQIQLRGNEGLQIAGKEVVWVAHEDVYLKSVNASIILDGKNGVSLVMDKFPIAKSLKSGGTYQYKICVCSASGRLFRIELKQLDYSCAHAILAGKSNPCAKNIV